VSIITGYLMTLGVIRFTFLNNKKIMSKKWFVIISSILLFLIAAFRSIYFGPDVLNYLKKYISLSYISVSTLWMNVINNEGTDPFFSLFSKAFNFLGVTPQMWLSILSGIFIYSISSIIYKYSDEPYISFIALISLGYFYFSLTGLRQTMAISILLFSFKYLKERRVLPFIIVVFISSLFHSSALIFLIAYPFANVKIGFKHFLGLGVAIIMAVFFKNQIREIIKILSWTDRLANYANREVSLTWSGFILQLSIYLFCLFYKKNVLKYDNDNLILYNLLFLGLFFQVFAIVIAEFFRVSMYFSIFSIILITKAINAEENVKLRNMIFLAVFMALLGYIYWTGNFKEFKFFWEV